MTIDIEIEMDKVIDDGKVAVIISYGFGSGWYTSGFAEEVVFDPGLVNLVRERDKLPDRDARVKEYNERILIYCELKWPNEYYGGLDDLSIEWLPVGTKFMINSYDGTESIISTVDLNLEA